MGKLGPFVRKSSQDEVYVALRKMLKTRVLSDKTRENIQRAVNRLNREAAKEAIRNAFEGAGSAAAH